MEISDTDIEERTLKNKWFLKYLQNKGFTKTFNAVSSLDDLSLEQARIQFYIELDKDPSLKQDLLLYDETDEKVHFDPKYGDIFADQSEQIPPSNQSLDHDVDNEKLIAFDERLGDILKNQHTHLKDKNNS